MLLKNKRGGALYITHYLCHLFFCVFLKGDLDYSSVLLGMLVMQDVQLGLLIAVMPTLIQAQSGELGGSVHLLVLSMCPHTHSLSEVCSCLFQPQDPVWKSPHLIPAGPGPGLSGSCAAAVFVTEIFPDWSLLQETACWEQRQQGNPGAGDGSVCVFYADGTHFVYTLQRIMSF